LGLFRWFVLWCRPGLGRRIVLGHRQEYGHRQRRTADAQRQPQRVLGQCLAERERAEHRGEQAGHRRADRHDQRGPAALQRRLRHHQAERAGEQQEIGVRGAEQVNHRTAQVT